MKKPPSGGFVAVGRGSGRGLGRLDGFFGGAGRRAQVRVLGRQQEGVNASAFLDRADGTGADPEGHGLAEGLAQHRGLLQVRDEPAASLVVGVADIVASHRGFPGEFTTTGHGLAPNISFSNRQISRAHHICHLFA